MLEVDILVAGAFLSNIFLAGLTFFKLRKSQHGGSNCGKSVVHTKKK